MQPNYYRTLIFGEVVFAEVWRTLFQCVFNSDLIPVCPVTEVWAQNTSAKNRWGWCLLANWAVICQVRMNEIPKIHSFYNTSCSNSTVICSTALVESWVNQQLCVLIDGATSNTRSISDCTCSTALLRPFRSFTPPNTSRRTFCCSIDFLNLITTSGLH